MKIIYAFGLAVLLLLGAPANADMIRLSAPVLSAPGTSTWRVGRVDLFFEANQIGIMLIGENGERKEIAIPLDGRFEDVRKRLTKWLVGQGHVTGTLVVE